MESEDRDYLNLKYEQSIIQFFKKDEKVYFSGEVYKDTFLFFKKAKIVLVTNEQIYVVDRRKKVVKKRNKIDELLGITKSLYTDSKNFILHFSSRADEELFCDYRNELVGILKRRYFEITQGNLKIFGVSTRSLKDFLTSERDQLRRISKIPSNDYRLWEEDIVKEQRRSAGGSIVQQNDEDDLDYYDDFVIIERLDIKKYNEPKKLEEEEKIKDSGESQLLIQKPGSENQSLKLEDFKIKKVIDKGSFGKVFLVVNKKNKKLYAMKRINKDILIDKNQIQNTKNEKDILFQANHPFVLSMDYIFQNQYRLYFFLKYVRGGNLYDHLFANKRFPEATVKFYAAQIAVALGYLHANKIVHRDLKPENVLVDEDGYLYLADFGLSKFLQGPQDQTHSFCGTAEYLAPEILDMKGHGFTVDWWTFGILVYEMSTGRPPFMHKNHHQLGMLIRNSPIVYPDPIKHKIHMSDLLKDLINKLLDRDPHKRLGSKDDINDIINHPFFKDVDFEKLQKKEIIPLYKPPQNLFTIKDEELQVLFEDPELKDITEEDNNDEIPVDKRLLIDQNKNKFEGFDS